MKSSKETIEKSVTPPYLSIAKLEEVINLASNRSYSEFPVQLFVNRGFNMADAFLAVNTLKFLSLIDEDGKPTELMGKIGLKGDARKKTFNEIVRNAYKRLFDAVRNAPQDLPRDELYNEIKTQYGLSKRIADYALPVFLKLCEYAGLKEEGSVISRKRGPKTSKTASKTIKETDSSVVRHSKEELNDWAVRAGFSPTRVAEGRMVLDIPATLKDKILEGDDEALHEDWRNLRMTIKKFADKYLPEDKPPYSPESEDD